MADDIDQVTGVSNNTAIELYRAKIATPTTLEETIFFVQQELKRIEGSFLSVDEVLKLIASVGGDGTGGECEPCQDGEDGDDGRGIQTYKQSGTPVGAQAGDVWFVQGYK